MNDWPYVLACVVAPGIVGACMYKIFGIWEKRRRRKQPSAIVPEIDYWI
jgi:hypothetical protein